MNGVVVVLGIDIEGEDIIRVDVYGKVGITPDGAAALAVRTDLGRRTDLVQRCTYSFLVLTSLRSELYLGQEVRSAWTQTTIQDRINN